MSSTVILVFMGLTLCCHTCVEGWEDDCYEAEEREEGGGHGGCVL